MAAVNYASVGRQLRAAEDRPALQATTRAVVLVARVDEATLRAVGYARGMRPREVRGVHVGRGGAYEALGAEWASRCPGLPLEHVSLDGRDRVDAIRSYVRSLHPGENEFITVVVPEILYRSGWRQFVRRREALLLKAALLFEPGVVVTDVPTFADETPAETEAISPRPVMPARITAIVLVSAVHNATLRAIGYARSLRPTELRAVSFNLDPDESERVVRDWGRWNLDLPLEIIDSPYREVTEPLVRYVRGIRQTHPETVVAVVLPEFVVGRWWHQFLHNQTALAIKAALLFEPGVVVTSVPFHLR